MDFNLNHLNELSECAFHCFILLKMIAMHECFIFGIHYGTISTIQHLCKLLVNARMPFPCLLSSISFSNFGKQFAQNHHHGDELHMILFESEIVNVNTIEVQGECWHCSIVCRNCHPECMQIEKMQIELMLFQELVMALQL